LATTSFGFSGIFFILFFKLLSTSFTNILFVLFRYKYASVLYHKQWLHSIMHASNLLHVMALSFCESPVVEVSGSVKTVMYDDCEGVVGGHGNMSCLTGIPAHIAILNRMDKLES
jgi:hypothetical protein